MLRRCVAVGVAAVGLAGTGCGAESASLLKTSESVLAEDDFIAVVSQAEYAAKSVSMDLTVSGPRPEQRLRMAGDLRMGTTPAEMALQLTVDSAGFPFSVTVVDQMMYLEMGALTDGKYVAYDLNDPATPMGDLLSGAQVDPTAPVRGFRGAIEGFDIAGTAWLDDVETIRYRLTANTERLLANLATTPDAVFGPGVAAPVQLTYEFWVGPDRLPRRISFTSADVTTQMDLSGWGETVDIRPPPATEITDVDPFAEGPVASLV